MLAKADHRTYLLTSTCILFFYFYLTVFQTKIDGGGAYVYMANEIVGT